MSEDSNRKSPQNGAIDVSAARANLASSSKQRLWRGLEELSQTPAYRDSAKHEFAEHADQVPDGIARRDVLKLMGASAALAGLSACTKLPTEHIVPYVRPPEEIIPGRPLFYATSFTQPGGVAAGLLVESNMGRPTKIEGNPEHPGSLGGTDVFSQASVLDMYDPDRSQTILFEGRLSSWSDFAAALGNVRARLTAQGNGVRILTKTVTSPSLAAQIRKVLDQIPGAKWHQYEPCGGDTAREGARLAFGRPVNTVYHADRADVILALDADFLTEGPGHVRYTREFSSRRDLAAGPTANLNRLYAVESMATATGASADHRLQMRSTDVEAFARQVAAAVGVSVPGGGSGSGPKVPADWMMGLTSDLMQHRGSSLVVVGQQQPPIVHALAHAINAALGNAGKTVAYTEPLEAEPVNEVESLRDLVNDLNANKVEFLLILGANPVYDAPADFGFRTALFNAKLRAHVGRYVDETGELCHWHAPASHYLEAWGDARGYDGTVGIVQPLISPLYDSHSDHEVLALLTGDSSTSGHDLVRNYWQSQRPEKGKAFEAFWETSLHDGLMAGTALPEISVPMHADFASQAAQPSGANGVELVFRPDPSIGDGEFANNAWLQELPKPITRITWDNAAMMSPKTAQTLGLTTGSYVKLHLGDSWMEAAVFMVPGHVDDSVTLHLGYGRSLGGGVAGGDGRVLGGESAGGAGFNAYVLRTSSNMWMAQGLRIEKTDKKYEFASMQHQYVVESDGQRSDDDSNNAFRRDLIQIATLDEFRKDPAFAQVPAAHEDKSLSLYPAFANSEYGWGMSIDLNRCVGCNACVIACQSENNIAVVGKEQVIRGRAMHWIRIDTYFKGAIENPEMYYEPLPCMQCENAPCEYVCPVGATTHSPEGLNDMTYNRCVGTRYCSNNCPYKVRRFNFYLFSDFKTPSLYGVRNPNVTVRSRGVMEKCTYCVQRIQEAKIHSQEEDRSIRDGEIITACQQACPAEAIVFGNINDSASRVSKLKAQSRDYVLLADLNTRPRTSYLARVRNPNPEIHS